MKFQILVKSIDQMQAIATGHTHEAMCFAPIWLMDCPIRILGDSKEDAKERVVNYIQNHLDKLGGKWFEVDLSPMDLPKKNE